MAALFGLLGEADKVKKGKQNNVYNTETMLPISEIRGDTIILKDSGLRAILKVTGLNIDLRNYDEQQAVVEQYKRFLNALDFPIQIFVRNTYLELSDYITFLRQQLARRPDGMLKDQGESYISFLDGINTKQGLLFTKEFYVIIPYYAGEEDEAGVNTPRWRKFLDSLNSIETPEKIVQRYRGFLKNDKYLDTRISVVTEGLKSLGMYADRLGSSDLLSLLFRCYNPESHKNQSEFME